MNVSRQSETMIVSHLFHYRTLCIFTVACFLCFGINSLEQDRVFHNKQACNRCHACCRISMFCCVWSTLVWIDNPDVIIQNLTHGIKAGIVWAVLWSKGSSWCFIPTEQAIPESSAEQTYKSWIDNLIQSLILWDTRVRFTVKTYCNILNSKWPPK